MSATPSVFCAVIAVTADTPYTPSAANVLRSAWMPAPAMESLPAMVSAVRMRSVLLAEDEEVLVGQELVLLDELQSRGCGLRDDDARRHALGRRRAPARLRLRGSR